MAAIHDSKDNFTCPREAPHGSFGEKLQTLRETMRVSREFMAHALGQSQPGELYKQQAYDNYAAFETGKALPSDAQFALIAPVFDTAAKWSGYLSGSDVAELHSLRKEALGLGVLPQEKATTRVFTNKPVEKPSAPRDRVESQKEREDLQYQYAWGLREKMRENGYSVSDFAHKAGISTSTFSTYRTKKNAVVRHAREDRCRIRRRADRRSHARA